MRIRGHIRAIPRARLTLLLRALAVCLLAALNSVSPVAHHAEAGHAVAASAVDTVGSSSGAPDLIVGVCHFSAACVLALAPANPEASPPRPVVATAGPREEAQLPCGRKLTPLIKPPIV